MDRGDLMEAGWTRGDLIDFDLFVLAEGVGEKLGTGVVRAVDRGVVEGVVRGVVEGEIGDIGCHGVRGEEIEDEGNGAMSRAVPTIDVIEVLIVMGAF